MLVRTRDYTAIAIRYLKGKQRVAAKENSNLLYSSSTESPLKFIFSKKATKIDEIFTVNLTLTT